MLDLDYATTDGPLTGLNHRILTHEEEIKFGTDVQTWLASVNQQNEFRNHLKTELAAELGREPQDEEVDLEMALYGITPDQKLQEEYSTAREELSNNNQRLVLNMAKKYSGEGVFTIKDHFQDGQLGLLTAIDKYDPTRGFRFSTYATWWIRQAINKGVGDTAHTIRIPSNLQSTARSLGVVQGQAIVELGREPTDEELIKIWKEQKGKEITKERMNNARQVYQIQPISLDAPVGTDDDLHREELIPDTRFEDPEENAIQMEKREILANVLEKFSPRTKIILMLRFGLSDDKQHTLEEVGQEIGLTRERVRQIEQKALLELRINQEIQNLRSS